MVELPHHAHFQVVAGLGNHPQEDVLGDMRLEAITLGAIDHLLRISAVGIAVVLLGATDKLQE